MFVPLTEKDKQTFLAQTAGSFIPGHLVECSTSHFIVNIKHNPMTFWQVNDHEQYKVAVIFNNDSNNKFVIIKIEVVPTYLRVEKFSLCRYTGHCPTLKFHFGKCYGTKTKEIIQEIRDKSSQKQVQRNQYRVEDYVNPVLVPIIRNKGQNHDCALNTINRAPKYILGYTGFIPTINFRYGKSFGRSADDSISDFTNKQRRLRERREELDRMYRAKSAPRLSSIRSKDEVSSTLRDYEEKVKFKEKEISSEFPPIAGYTGHIPRVNGNEESLSRRYNTVVKRGLSLLKEDRERRDDLRKTQNKLAKVFNEAEGKYSYKDDE